MRKLPPTTVNKDVLARLVEHGCDSSALLARVELIQMEGLRRALMNIKGRDRIFPEMLPTQASLRWSTTRPPLATFDKRFWLHPAIRPDDREWWLEWDWSGIESRMFTGYSGDPNDLEMFRSGRDIHTETAKILFGWSTLPGDWRGKDDKRRDISKNIRYGPYQYAKDERVILSMPGLDTVGLDRHQALAAIRRLFAAHPATVAFKQRTWEECVRTRQARTFLGHRRMLWGNADTMAKEGLNHKIQGGVAGMMDWCIIQICHPALSRFLPGPLPRLILNKHDGAIIGFPSTMDMHDVLSVCQGIVEREWEIEGNKISFPATWVVWHAEGRREELAA